ncbi:hypothetical protein ASE73_02640 [Sphingomonas sp. Leaf24]|uniref:hypothetical protein n=1 Tax=unclassified Sphingomonas TaxID=196159 RepID=UPI0006F61417|nr:MULTISPECIES: hypothetical protein [unclassified Sphingomonas]KQM23141.1 hypothetical protein ASE50_02640 [Sphingomonas sp. Leaf5]KQM95999.1 hypothetical protein ASE73_02640 [Sphingomonas sp. Leaf24]
MAARRKRRAGRATPRSVARPVWAALIRAAVPLSAPDLQRCTGLALCAIHKRLAAWRDAGLLTETPERPHRYAMTDLAIDAPCAPITTNDNRVLFRPRTTRDRIWAAMRVLKTFDMPTLLIVAEVEQTYLRSYFNALLRAGYVETVPSAATQRYRLLLNTGPKAPSLVNQRGGGRIVRDRNTGRTTPAPPARTYRRSSTAPLADGGVS